MAASDDRLTAIGPFCPFAPTLLTAFPQAFIIGCFAWPFPSIQTNNPHPIDCIFAMELPPFLAPCSSSGIPPPSSSSASIVGQSSGIVLAHHSAIQSTPNCWTLYSPAEVDSDPSAGCQSPSPCPRGVPPKMEPDYGQAPITFHILTTHSAQPVDHHYFAAVSIPEHRLVQQICPPPPVSRPREMPKNPIQNGPPTDYCRHWPPPQNWLAVPLGTNQPTQSTFPHSIEGFI